MHGLILQLQGNELCQKDDYWRKMCYIFPKDKFEFGEIQPYTQEWTKTDKCPFSVIH